MAALETEKASLEGELARQADDPEQVVALLPDVATVYRRKVDELTEALTHPSIRNEAGMAIRSLVKKVVVVPEPGQPDGVSLVLHGALAEILALGSGHRPKTKRPGAVGLPRSQVSVVAGA